ncbi:hypothetical protein CGRA01v4_15132 [Colletotrichum graminicola]|nr:hypothetical protein CGRA01v4_15132 [Colletotrichum graminicola]
MPRWNPHSCQPKLYRTRKLILPQPAPSIQLGLQRQCQPTQNQAILRFDPASSTVPPRACAVGQGPGQKPHGEREGGHDPRSSPQEGSTRRANQHTLRPPLREESNTPPLPSLWRKYHLCSVPKADRILDILLGRLEHPRRTQHISQGIVPSMEQHYTVTLQHPAGDSAAWPKSSRLLRHCHSHCLGTASVSLGPAQVNSPSECWQAAACIIVCLMFGSNDCHRFTCCSVISTTSPE